MSKLQNSIEGSNYPITGGLTFPSFYDDVQTVSSLNIATGTTDLYTVPAGKRAVMGYSLLHNASGVGNIVWNYAIKVSGTSYRINSNTTTANAATSTAVIPNIILEAGEIFQITTATNSGANFWCKIFTFDANFPLYSPKIFNPASGDNTLYTCPADTKAVITTANGNENIASTGLMSALNNSGGALNFSTYVVPSGGSTGTTNRIFNAIAIGDLTSNIAFTTNAILNAGDFLVFNLSGAGGANSICWTNVFELV